MGTGALAAACLLTVGCTGTVSGSATWPGATLERVSLGSSDFPSGVRVDRITDDPGQPDGAAGPGPMLSRPERCANALTNVIARSADRGPGSAAKYAASYDGARIVMTVLSWNLDLAKLDAEAVRCARFEALFDPGATGIPITTAGLSGLEAGALAFQQTMQLGTSRSTVFMAFQNVGDIGVFGLAFSVPDPGISAKAALPQTFLDVFAAQIAKIRSS